ncbi:hypothetical protein F5Y12DRAFT_765478 [Xylaria sp. FL1777]|nr:hypothetical protein F5Y12DRAFT_765478 [Xylaria sp. FL1777]
MGSTSPPRRMTRARAAAASAAATALSPKAAKSDRVTKSTKATTASAKTTAAATKKTAAAAKSIAKTAAKTAANTTAKSTAKPAAKSTTKPAAKTAMKATTTATDTTVTTTATVSKKRKHRTGEDTGEDELSNGDNTQHTMNQPAKKLRGRAKKAVDPEPQSDSELESESQSTSQEKGARGTATTTRSTRGRPKRSIVDAASSSAAKKQTPSTLSHTRTRKASNINNGDQDAVADAPKQPAKKTTRRRAATGTITTAYTTEPTPGLKSAVSRPASKITGVLKKTVTFEEPEKENMLPGAATKAKTETTGTTATGMRAKPVRMPTTTSGRTTRASARAARTDATEKKPLSPKKDGQNRHLSRDAADSDDELATYEKTPLKPLMKSPVKPPTSVRKLELPLPDKEKDANSPLSSEPTFASVFSSPARRPPPSPFKNAMMSPAKRVDPISGLFTSSSSADEQATGSPTKSAMLHSPAKRPHMPLQVFQLHQEEVSATRSPTKMSLLSTPAKRPTSPVKLLGSLVPQMGDKPQEVSQAYMHTPTEEISDEQLQSQIRAETGAISPEESAGVEKTLGSIQEVDDDSIQFESPTPQLEFPGRLSAVLPRHADPALKQNPLPLPELTIQPPQLHTSEPQKSEQVTMSESPSSEANIRALLDDGMHICKAMIKEQPNDVGVTGSAEESMDDELDVKSAGRCDNEQLVNTPAVKNQLQHVELCAAESGVRSTDVCETLSESQSMDKSEAIAKELIVRDVAQTTPAPTKRAGFGLRTKDLGDEIMSDSEDELAFSNKAITKHQGEVTFSDSVPVTPAPPIFKGTERKISESVARAASRAIRSVSKANNLGYTPLSVQLGAWRASSPLKAAKSTGGTEDVEDDEDEFSLLDENDFPVVETPAAKGFFDDEMKIRDDMETEAAMEAFLEADIAAKFDKHDFHDLGLMDEELSIITEESEMSLINTAESEQSHSHDKSVSAASQEYGDENAVPIDPALFSNETNASIGNNIPVTPKRPFASREVHTVSKVPLKRADDSPPRSVKRHCSTVSKATSRRPSGPFSNVSLPSKPSFNMTFEGETDQESKLPSVTPSKPVPWSSVGTPARTTRPDLNPTLLRGAIVFVDVHTTEGADAGRIFVDLLVQMGARCVKSWPWNPATSMDAKVDISKVGITHVVFKDGGKRTLEKVNESNGNVQCVGVSWVLE